MRKLLQYIVQAHVCTATLLLWQLGCCCEALYRSFYWTADEKNVAGVYIGEASVNSTHQGNFYIRKIFLVAIRASIKSRVYFVCLFVESVGWRRMAEEEFFW